MTELTTAKALCLAINVLRNSAANQKMPSGMDLSQCASDLHAAAAKVLEEMPAVACKRYRSLVPEVDRIEASDEFLSDDTLTWAVDPNAIFSGMIYGGRVLRPARRQIAA